MGLPCNAASRWWIRRCRRLEEGAGSAAPHTMSPPRSGETPDPQHRAPRRCRVEEGPRIRGTRMPCHRPVEKERRWRWRVGLGVPLLARSAGSQRWGGAAAPLLAEAAAGHRWRGAAAPFLAGSASGQRWGGAAAILLASQRWRRAVDFFLSLSQFCMYDLIQEFDQPMSEEDPLKQ